jgi:hypothetical protein
LLKSLCVAALVIMLFLTPDQAFAVRYYWLKPGESFDLVFCPHGSSAAHIRRGKSVSRAGNGGYYHKTGRFYVPIGDLWIAGKEIYSYKAPTTRGWIYKSQEGKTHISSQAPENPQLCLFATRVGAVLVENGKAKTKQEIAASKERHRDISRLRHIVVIKEGNIGDYYATGTLWQIAQKLAKEGVDSAINVDGGSSVSPRAKVAWFFVHQRSSDSQEMPTAPRPPCFQNYKGEDAFRGPVFSSFDPKAPSP